MSPRYLKGMVLVILPLLFIAVGCASSFTKPLYKMGDLETNRPASSMPGSKSERDLTVGAKLYADSRFCIKFFGMDLIYEGFIPVLVAFENTPNNNSFDIRPSKFRLEILDGAKQIVLKPVSIRSAGFDLEVEKYIEPKLFPEWRLTAGQKKNGFVLFDARSLGWDEETMKKKLVNSLLTIKVTKIGLPKPKDLTKLKKNPKKYRGEDISIPILFEKL